MIRILFIGFPYSIHAARWISQVVDSGWDIHFFPSAGRTTESELHPLFRNLTVHDCATRQPGLRREVCFPDALAWPFRAGEQYARFAVSQLRRRWPSILAGAGQAAKLARLIQRLKPDIVQSLELQHAGYLALEAKRLLGKEFPTWIATNWGSDIYLFSHMEEHRAKIQEVLAGCDYYSCECHRDIGLAKQLGFMGRVLPVLPNAGGLDIRKAAALRQPGPSSARSLVLVKGYQHWAGRALVALRAVALCADLLGSHQVAVFSASADVEIAARLVSSRTGVPIDLIPLCSHDDMLRQYGKARVYLGLSISDAISTSLLEALTMGAFPIQSCTACAEEWIRDGHTGFIVPPEDPQPVAVALRRALTDDALVDSAAAANAEIAAERLDERVIRPQVIAMYERIALQEISDWGEK